MCVAVIISMQYFLFFDRELGRGLDNDFFSYKKLVNWVSFYSSGKIEGYFFSFNVIFVIWPIKFLLKFEFLVWVFFVLLIKNRSFLRDFWIMFHTHSKQNYEPRLFSPYKNHRIEYCVMFVKFHKLCANFDLSSKFKKNIFQFKWLTNEEFHWFEATWFEKRKLIYLSLKLLNI